MFSISSIFNDNKIIFEKVKIIVFFIVDVKIIGIISAKNKAKTKTHRYNYVQRES